MTEQHPELHGAIRALASKFEGVLKPETIDMYHEIEELGNFITKARAELAALSPKDIQDHYLPAATDELDAIVGATEEATGRILDAVEKIEGVAGGLEGPNGEQLNEAVTQIYEACGFQDITGQRITKVIATFHQIETKIASLRAALGEQGASAPAPQKQAPKDIKSDKDLLNGPQLPDDAKKQDEIDALMASF